jgi:hypothetical protein
MIFVLAWLFTLLLGGASHTYHQVPALGYLWTLGFLAATWYTAAYIRGPKGS